MRCRRSYSDNSPREIVAKFASVCAETGQPIKAAETCIYYPLSRKVYHVTSKQAAEFRSVSFDAGWLGVEY